MLVFGFGITTDVEHIRYAALDRDQYAGEAAPTLEQFAGSTATSPSAPPLADDAELDRRLQSARCRVVLEIPPDFGRDLARGRARRRSAQVDGAMTFRGETVARYVQGVHAAVPARASRARARRIEPGVHGRDRVALPLQPDVREHLLDGAGGVPLLLLLIPAILMAVSIVREKELGSIINFYVTPTTRLEYLLGKQLPTSRSA